MVFLKRALVAGGLALGGLAMTAGPASAAVGATIDSVDRAGCELTVNVTVEDAGTYFLTVFDDQVILGGDSATVAEGATAQLRYTIVSDVNARAPGLGLAIYDNPDADGAYLDAIENYDFPGSDDIATACAESRGTDSGETTPTTATTTPGDATTTTAPSAGDSPSNIDAPSSDEAPASDGDGPASDGDGPSSPDDGPSSPDAAPAPILTPKFTG